MRRQQSAHKLRLPAVCLGRSPGRTLSEISRSARRMQGPDCSGCPPQIIRGYSLAARWRPQPIDEPVPRSTLRLRDNRRVHPRNHPAPRPYNKVRAGFDRLAEARLVRNSRGLRCGLRLRRRQPIRTSLRQAAARARRRRFVLCGFTPVENGRSPLSTAVTRAIVIRIRRACAPRNLLAARGLANLNLTRLISSP